MNDDGNKRRGPWIIGGAILIGAVIVAVTIALVSPEPEIDTSGIPTPLIIEMTPCEAWEEVVQRGLDEFADRVDGNETETGRAMLREIVYNDGRIVVGGEEYVKPPECEP